MESLKGKLLVAAPALQDPNFNRTVVLIVQHNEDGAVGLVLNRQTELTFEAIWEQISDSPPCEPPEDRLFAGGPCEGPVMFLDGHRLLGQQVVASDNAELEAGGQQGGQQAHESQPNIHEELPNMDEDYVEGADEPSLSGQDTWDIGGDETDEADETGSSEVIPGLYFGADVGDVFHLIEKEKGPRSFFLGYAGWGSMQLEMELATGSWFIWPARADHIFDRQQGSWASVANEIHDAELLKPLEGKHWPSDPKLN